MVCEISSNTVSWTGTERPKGIASIVGKGRRSTLDFGGQPTLRVELLCLVEVCLGVVRGKMMYTNTSLPSLVQVYFIWSPQSNRHTFSATSTPLITVTCPGKVCLNRTVGTGGNSRRASSRHASMYGSLALAD